MKLLTVGGLLYSAVNAATDTTDSQGNEGSFELFDYVITINASELATALELLQQMILVALAITQFLLPFWSRMTVVKLLWVME